MMEASDSDDEVVVVEAGGSQGLFQDVDWDGKSKRYLLGMKPQGVRWCPYSYSGNGNCGWDAVGSELSCLQYSVTHQGKILATNGRRPARNTPSQTMKAIAGFLESHPPSSELLIESLSVRWKALASSNNLRQHPSFNRDAYAALLRTGDQTISRDLWCNSFDLVVVAAWLESNLGQGVVPIYRFHISNGMYVRFRVSDVGPPPAVAAEDIDPQSSVIVCTNGLHYMPLADAGQDS